MSDHNVADSYGAVDLSAAEPPQAPGPSVQASVDAPLIEAVTAETFEAQVGLSHTLPVVLVIYSGRSLPSQQAVTVLENAAREFAGAFALRKIDADTQPELVAGLQVQTLPTCIALVGRQPVPLFEGVASAEQLRSLIKELLQAAPQVGATGRIAVPEEQLETPMPPAHEAPRAAEDAEDWASAIQLWKKVLANNPSDQEAKLALARAEFEARQSESASPTDPLTKADQLFSGGREAEAFALLLEQIAAPADPDAKEAARARLVELFRLATDTDAVRQARTRLATMLMI